MKIPWANAMSRDQQTQTLQNIFHTQDLKVFHSAMVLFAGGPLSSGCEMPVQLGVWNGPSIGQRGRESDQHFQRAPCYGNYFCRNEEQRRKSYINNFLLFLYSVYSIFGVYHWYSQATLAYKKLVPWGNPLGKFIKLVQGGRSFFSLISAPSLTNDSYWYAFLIIFIYVHSTMIIIDVHLSFSRPTLKWEFLMR